MDKQTCKLVIEKIEKKLADYSGTSKATQKPYTIYSWIVTCTVDGQRESGTKISTMAQSNVALVVEGASFDAEKKDWQGQISYNLPPPPKAGGFGGGSGGGRSFTPAVAYTKEQLEDLYGWSIATAGRHLDIDISKCKADEKQVLQNGAATLLIAAQKCGLKIGG